MSRGGEKISLVAGQQCTIVASGLVTVQLAEGVIEIAGVVLESQQQYTFMLEGFARSLTFYTLEGGSVTCTGCVAETHISNTEVAPLLRLANAIAQKALSGKPICLAVVGNSGTGKTHAAHTIANALCQHYRRSTVSTPSLYLCDLNGSQNCVYAPCCVSCVEIATETSNKESPLWPSYTASPSRVQCSFFTGDRRSTIEASNFNQFLHHTTQLHECAEALAKNKSCVATSRPTGILLYDVPSCDPKGGIPQDVLCKKLFDVVKPTHVVFTGNSDCGWFVALREDLSRGAPQCEVVSVPMAPAVPLPPKDAFLPGLRSYFSGTVSQPLGSSKVVVDLSEISWLRTNTTSCEVVDPTREQLGHVLCGISHAVVAEEAPFANIAGVVVVVSVDEQNNEAVLIVPSTDESLPNNICLVPHNGASWKLSSDEMKAIEETVAV